MKLFAYLRGRMFGHSRRAAGKRIEELAAEHSQSIARRDHALTRLKTATADLERELNFEAQLLEMGMPPRSAGRPAAAAKPAPGDHHWSGR